MKTKKRFLGILLTLTLVLGLMPEMSLTAYAADITGPKDCSDLNAGDVIKANATITRTGGQKFYVFINGSGIDTGGSNQTVTVNGQYQATGDYSGIKSFTAYSDFIVSANEPPSGGSYYWLRLTTHTHNFTYNASGDTITATCGATGCGLTSNPTLTIVKPTLTTYGETGKSEAATLDGVADFNTATSLSVADTAIKYYKATKGEGDAYTKGDEITTGAPTGAGDYIAEITVSGVKTGAESTGDVTASVGYTIAKAETTITTAPTAGEITYGQTLADSTLTGGEASAAGSFAWKDSTVAPAVSDSQTTEYDVVFTPTDANYDTAECKVKLTVNKADAVAATVTANTLTYTGSAQALVTVTGEASGGTMYYELGTDAENAPSGMGADTSIPTGTEAGTYYVWYKVVGDDSHTDSEPACVTVTIEEQKQNKDEAVANVIDLINKLPSPSEVTANDKAQIEAARTAYDALTDEQKGKIPEETLKKLTDSEAALAEALKNTGDTQQNPDGSKTVTKENADGKTILVTNYSKTDEQISQFVFKKANGTKLDLKNVNSKNLKTVVVPATVKANGKTYKVTRIRKGFLKNCKQATKVDIGKNINTIDKNAFNYGKKVKTVIIRGKLKKVGKGAFKNTKKNVIIKVKTGEKNFEKNKALLEKSGLPKNATVKRVKNKK